MPHDPGSRPEARAAFARFQALVLDDASLQDRLVSIEDVAAFVDAAAEAARLGGLDLTADDLQALLRSPAQPILVDGGNVPSGWLPAEVAWDGARSVVDWAYFGRRRLVEPFYEGSLRTARRLPLNQLFRIRTLLSDLEARPGATSRRPDGFIFHMSRCGSTLAAQMLAAVDGHVVVSEAPPLDAVVQLCRADETAHAPLLRAMVGALGQVRIPGEVRYFVKLDSWHVLALPLFRRTFPDAPWVFLYRDPVEVMVSQARQRGVQMVPDFVPPSLYGLDLPGGVPDEDYWARVLAVICQAAADGHAGGGGLLVNYRQLPGALASSILPHFGIAPTPEEHRAMARATLRDAKAPSFGFTADSTAKQQAATQAVQAACARHLAGVYGRLEDIRLGRQST
jgi:hypothetical protein